MARPAARPRFASGAATLGLWLLLLLFNTTRTTSGLLLLV
jgi:hypothetical protein